ncbi:hypothetical protein K443DRAFT_3503 [Laccaria amethystina LaAM-08-1]|uniref:Uncharacterized protein n=1 Tax=Laccaria amethystina LaAM-08-1 TaxID=1095629 RepID=A0A0C9XWK9_9AGAR|nr:hypothetical protein K443DRAFT_3503 [Laccaria amethystina LaAM-08-1]
MQDSKQAAIALKAAALQSITAAESAAAAGHEVEVVDEGKTMDVDGDASDALDRHVR